MKAIRALMLVLALSISASAGNMECDKTGDMPNGRAGEMQTGKTGEIDNGKSGEMPTDLAGEMDHGKAGNMPGTGSLAIWSRSIGAQSICNEINPCRNALLTQELGFETYQLDAEIIDDLLPAEPHIKIYSKRYRLLPARKR